MTGATLLIIATACATSPAPNTPSSDSLAPTTVPSSATETPDTSPCMDRCIRQNMARAVAADVIEADCKRSCIRSAENLDATPSL